METVSISEAARLAGISRQHFYKKYIKQGLVSISILGEGKKVIDVSELLRVFGKISNRQDDNSGSGNSLQKATPNNDNVNKALETELSALQQVIQAKDALVSAKEEQIKAMAEHSRFLEGHIKELTQSLKLLENKSQTQEKRSSFWDWFKSN